ncbi:hypothetical protein PIPA1_45820 [Pelosinus sp. IPA-1]|nr:hypothetical protein PIPA1_45820 [Pelosinus sp. IPA-1]
MSCFITKNDRFGILFITFKIKGFCLFINEDRNIKTFVGVMFIMCNIEKRVAIVAGAASGIGNGIALALAHNGYYVFFI